MRRVMMSYLMRRLMFLQNKFGSVYVVSFVTVILMLFIFIRIQRDVERLDAARIRLEDTLATFSGNTRLSSSAGVSQMRFASNITSWSAVKPAFYHGHMAFIEFSRFGMAIRPVYINVVRDPVDRLVSYYYFLRNGDDFRPHLKRRRAGDRETFDECVAKEGQDCSIEDLWMQIPFFCGHAAECWVTGSEWALQMAKINLANQYLVVGLTEEMEDFVAVLESVMPRYFAGALELYTTANRSHLRKTYNKMQPSAETIRRIQQSTIWKMENEFYEFAREQFHFVKRRTLNYYNGRISGVRSQQFAYEKIRPR